MSKMGKADLVEKVESTKHRFVVALPKGLPKEIMLQRYADIDKISGSIACTPRKAVTNYLMRVSKQMAPLIISILDTEMSGVEKYAFKVPEVAPEKGEFKGDEKREFVEYALADELAACYNGRPFDYIQKAREILEGFDKAVFEQ